MSDALIVGLISALVSLVSIFVSSKVTRDKMANKLDTNQQVMQNEMTHIKENMGTMQEDIRSHNNYAKLFNENIPVIREKLASTDRRLEVLETDMRFYHRRNDD